MNSQEQINYDRIARAIAFIGEHFQSQPDLDRIAEHVHMSPFHFQRLFKDWAGVTPKKFLQYTSLEYAKSIIRDPQRSLVDTAMETGLSGTGRLHDLFIRIEGMTPGEYRNGGSDLHIQYSYAPSPFGPLLIAATPKGICYIAFADDEHKALRELQQLFPNANYLQASGPQQQQALDFFTCDWGDLPQIRLHLKGSPFQLKVWEALLTIPVGALSTYGRIATSIHQPGASRAVGTAIGSNPVAFLIPCHRVIRNSGHIGGYHWGSVRKTAMMGWEAGKIHPETSVA